MTRSPHLKRESADGEGREILAVLADLLGAPFAAVDGGDGELVYVWPYLAVYEDLSALSPAEKVDEHPRCRVRRLQASRRKSAVGTSGASISTPRVNYRRSCAGD